MAKLSVVLADDEYQWYQDDIVRKRMEENGIFMQRRYFTFVSKAGDNVNYYVVPVKWNFLAVEYVNIEAFHNVKTGNVTIQFQSATGGTTFVNYPKYYKKWMLLIVLNSIFNIKDDIQRLYLQEGFNPDVEFTQCVKKQMLMCKDFPDYFVTIY